MLSALHGGCVLPTRGCRLPTRRVRSPYTEGLTFLHGKTGFAARRDASPHHAYRLSMQMFRRLKHHDAFSAVPCNMVPCQWISGWTMNSNRHL